VDSVAESKSRAHFRLASFGRIRSRGSIHNSAQRPPTGAATDLQPYPSETLSLDPLVPVLPTDASARPRRDTPPWSNRSSETTLIDDRSDVLIKPPLDEPPSLPGLGFTSRYLPRDLRHKGFDEVRVSEQSDKAPQSRPRAMHQTSSRLLRMTEDDRPYTRVRLPLPQIAVWRRAAQSPTIPESGAVGEVANRCAVTNRILLGD